ncbi:MAG: helix-hairpin-helix domain-containing protein [Thermoplasmataceae archaeon]|jgi:DNA polymerase (family 10)
MINQEIAGIFDEMADMEDLEGNRWQSLAYRKVSASILALGEDLTDIYRRGKLRDIDGVGDAIEKKIAQFIEHGKIDKYSDLKKKYPIDFQSLKKIQGLGPKKIFALYLNLGIRNVEDLMKAIEEKKISGLPGFGGKTESNLEKSVRAYLQSGSKRMFLADVYDDVIQLRKKLMDSRLFTSVEIVGSYRRMRETVGDIDILAVSDKPADSMNLFANQPEIDAVINKGPSKMTVLLKNGLNCDFRLFPKGSIGAALQYFTGSKNHNIRLRDIANNREMKLNEYGLFKGDMQVAGSDEISVYHGLGMSWIEPELRENMGEIESAMAHNLPKLIGYEDVRGDMHCHITESGGRSTLEEIVEAALRNKLDYIAVMIGSEEAKTGTEKGSHIKSSLIEKIRKINDSGSLKILMGLEVEIGPDGSLREGADVLKSADFVLGSMHDKAGTDAAENTRRMVRGIESGLLSGIAHPTGRIIGRHEGYPMDMERIFQACSDSNVLLEINGFPERSDLPFDLVKRAREYKLKFTLGSGSHSAGEMRYLMFATAIARRGWLEKEMVVNSYQYAKIIHEVKKTGS